MPPQAPWSPNAHAFAQHQFSHVANFWKQGRQASFQLEALPGGHAELNITFHLPTASEVIPPPTHVPSVVPPKVPPQCPTLRPIPPLFPNGWVPKGSSGANSKSQAPPKKVSSRLRRSYQRSVLHKAALAAPSLPPPKNGTLRQAALACVQRQQAVSASPVNTQCTKKRPLSDSPSALSPPHLPPLAQRIRSDIRIAESECESPETELLRSQPSPENSPSLISPPSVKDFPPPAPLAFTPLKTLSETWEGFETPTAHQGVVCEVAKVAEEDSDWETIVEDREIGSEDSRPSCLNCDARMTLGHQCEVIESDGSLEDVEDEQDLYPTFDVTSDSWAEELTNSIRRFHAVVAARETTEPILDNPESNT